MTALKGADPILLPFRVFPETGAAAASEPDTHTDTINTQPKHTEATLTDQNGPHRDTDPPTRDPQRPSPLRANTQGTWTDVALPLRLRVDTGNSKCRWEV